MIYTSAEFRRKLYYDEREFLYYADITLANGRTLSVQSDKLWNGGFKISDAVSQDNKFDVGDAIINKATLILNNIYEDFDAYDFGNSKVVLSIGMQLNTGLEKFVKFTGVVDEANYNGSLITLSVLDNMSKFDKDFDASGISFPCTIDTLIKYCCSKCGVQFSSNTYTNSGFIISSLPNTGSQALTYRQVLGYCAQICGCFARCNRYGTLEFGWYNRDTLERGSLNGGTFNTTTTPYSDGGKADGGTFNTTTIPYSDGDSFDDGFFGEQEDIHYFSSYYSHNLGIDDVRITGIRVLVKNSNGSSEVAEYTCGSSGHMVEISDNPFITTTNAQQIANFLGSKLVGLTFRTLTASIPTDPSIEAGDVGSFFDQKGNVYPVLISSVTFSSNDAQSIRSSGETPLTNTAKRYSQETKNYVDTNKQIKEETKAREDAIQEEQQARAKDVGMLEEALANSPGLYMSKETAADGSSIYYLHNHKDRASSDIIWKMTAEAWGVSTDGGRTWNAGMTVDGNFIAKQISTVGLKADWINAGTLDCTKLTVQGLVVGGNVSMGENATISWSKVNGRPTDLSDFNNDMGFVNSDQATVITSNAIKTATISASNIYGGTINSQGNVNLGGALNISSAGSSAYLGAVAGAYDTGAGLCYDNYHYFIATPQGASMVGSENAYIYATSQTVRAHWNLESDNNITAKNTVTSVKGTCDGSDKRMKHDIISIPDNEIKNAGKVDFKQFVFDHDVDNLKRFGIIAQDVAKYFPEEKYGMLITMDNGYYAVNYSQFLLLRLAYDEKRISELEAKLNG